MRPRALPGQRSRAPKAPENTEKRADFALLLSVFRQKLLLGGFFGGFRQFFGEFSLGFFEILLVSLDRVESGGRLGRLIRFGDKSDYAIAGFAVNGGRYGELKVVYLNGVLEELALSHLVENVGLDFEIFLKCGHL